MVSSVMNGSSEIFDKLNFMGGIISLAGYFIGFKFPDWDFKMKLKHRNILTHSPLAVMAMIILFLKNPNEITRFFIAGFSLGMAIHFIFDLFPKKWTGGALIQFPFIKMNLNGKSSQLFFKISSLICMTITIIFTSFEYEVFLLFILGMITLVKNISKEKKLMRPLLVYAALFALFSVIKYDSFYKIILGRAQWFLDITGQ